MIKLRPYIAFTINENKTYKLIQGQFNFPYNEILHKCFRNDPQSSLGTIEKVDKSLEQLNKLINGDIEMFLIIGYDQDPVIECLKEKCKIVDHGPDEIHSVPPNEIYGSNWNKRNQEKEWINTEDLISLIHDWKKVLLAYSDSVCVPYSAVKEDYLKDHPA